MKLKFPTVLCLTSICHRNLDREKARRQMERETKRKEWFRKSEGRFLLILVDRSNIRIGKERR